MVASDFELFYDVTGLESFKGIQKLKPKTYLIAPSSAINGKEFRIWEKSFGTEGIALKNEKEIIDIVVKILSNI